MPSIDHSLRNVLNRHLVFVGGKGGVGKTAVSQAIALAHSRKGKKTLWVAFEDPLRPPNELVQSGPNLWHLNCEASTAFEEYAGIKIGMSGLTRIFVQNKLIRYLAKAAPGIHELVLLGKLWYERLNYDVVVADMPSTGYGLAMFHSAANFSRLFSGGPLHRDTEAMLDTFSDPFHSGHLIVALPEEMPLRESLELDSLLRRLFPGNHPAFIVNRRFPVSAGTDTQDPGAWRSPVPESAEDYLRKRGQLEAFNLRIWREEGITFGELGFVPPPPRGSLSTIVNHLTEELQSKGYL